MSRKLILYILPAALILIFTVYISSFIQPKITFTANITSVTEEDYKRLLTNKQVMYQDQDIDKFKHSNISIKVTIPFGFTNNVKIDRDLLHDYLQSYDKIQLLSGGGFEHGNGKEYADNIEIYLINCSVDDLKDMLRAFRYKVTWSDLWNNKNDKIFYLKDYLQ